MAWPSLPDLAGAVGTAGGVFTLRQTPIAVPEPTTMLMLLAGMPTLRFRRRAKVL